MGGPFPRLPEPCWAEGRGWLGQRWVSEQAAGWQLQNIARR